MLHHDPAAKSHDRIGFTLTMAIALHAAVILGVGFMLKPPKAPAAKRMDITLSHYSSDEKVLDADFVAQTNQQASGEKSDAKELTTKESGLINDSEVQKLNTEQSLSSASSAQQSLNLINTTSTSQQKANNTEQKQANNTENLEKEIQQLQKQINLASLQAKQAQENQNNARIPRVRRAFSVATKKAEDANYLYHWQQRIEAIGNQHYPHAARAKKIYGNVRMLVKIDASGRLLSAVVTESSGHKILDDAALKIVRLSSPFKPFTAEMKKNIDILEIDRTWQFQKNRFGEK